MIRMLRRRFPQGTSTHRTRRTPDVLAGGPRGGGPAEKRTRSGAPHWGRPAARPAAPRPPRAARQHEEPGRTTGPRRPHLHPGDRTVTDPSGYVLGQSERAARRLEIQDRHFGEASEKLLDELAVRPADRVV